jgi:cellulose synthase/poly-beta-1,6-N-acetylglucosamine synthase-like glycosyltransferase
VIAVDNGSTDGTPAALAQLPVRVVPCARPGPAAARNAGIRAATAPVVAMTDSDCVPEPGWLARLVAPFSDPAVLGVGGRIDALTVTRGVEIFAEKYEVLCQAKMFAGVLGFPPFFVTANAAFRRDALLRVDGFDETLTVGEDADLAWRVLDLGGKLVYCHGAMVRHAHRRTFAGLFHQAFAYGEGAATVFARHRARFGRRAAVQWYDIAALAIMPLVIPWRIVSGADAYERKSGFYEAVYRAGFTLGRLRGSLKHRVVFL